MKKLILYISCFLIAPTVLAQDENELEEGYKGNFFTGGSVSLSFFNKSFLIGANPVFGYSITKWADVGVVGNINYASQKLEDFNGYEYGKIRQTTYGGGLFTRLFPVKFLFAQAQVEHNIIRQKEIYAGNTSIIKVSGNSFLVGGGYTTGRNPDAKNPFFYLSVLFDISDNQYSPYKDQFNKATPIIRAGFHIPLIKRQKTID